MGMQRGRCEMYLVRTLSTVGHMNFGHGGGGGGLSLEEKGRKENEYVVLRVTCDTKHAMQLQPVRCRKNHRKFSRKQGDGGGRDTCKLTKLM